MATKLTSHRAEGAQSSCEVTTVQPAMVKLSHVQRITSAPVTATWHGAFQKCSNVKKFPKVETTMHVGRKLFGVLVL